MTVLANVFERGALKPGEKLLIHGGSSGIGTMRSSLQGVRLQSDLDADRRTDRRRLKLGADRAINYKTETSSTWSRLRQWSRANLILDSVCRRLRRSQYDAAAIDGPYRADRTLNGPKVNVNIAKVMVKRLTHNRSRLTSPY